MQNKGAISLFAIIFAVVCLYQLSFTFVTSRTEKKAKNFAQFEEARTEAKKLAHGNHLLESFLFDSISKVREKYYIDSVANLVVYNIGIRKYTYKECKDREINLGLDLKGGMNVTLEVSVVDIIRTMSGNSQDSTFAAAINVALKKQRLSQSDFVDLFAQSFEEIAPNARLAAIFATKELKDRISPDSDNEEVIKVIREETDQAIDRTFQILKTRIDQFGVAQPNIQKLQTAGRILVELPGVKDHERVRKLLQGTARLEFWETYDFRENNNYNFLTQANDRITQYLNADSDLDLKDTTVVDKDTIIEKAVAENKSTKNDTTASLLDLVGTDTAAAKTSQDDVQKKSLFTYLQPNFIQSGNGQFYPNEGPVFGRAEIKDTARINSMLKLDFVKNIFPRNMRLKWTHKPMKGNRGAQTTVLELIALKTTNDGRASLSGDVITDARQDIGQNGGNQITMSMNAKGAKDWKKITGNNIGKSVAVVLDDYVYSFPVVNDEIPNGRSEISGDFTIEEAKDLANILKAGKIPAPARIVEEEVVGPSLGKEAINSGLLSFIVAFLMVLAYMYFYYNRAGLIADLALLVNVFFLFGVLASLGAVLTLPGIAGIVLTLGMAVDANVIIYERIKEELRAGKGIRLAISDGYKNAYSAIIDGNVTTLLIGIILFIFGSGPVQGFATTLIIGILTSLFTAIFISRIIFTNLLDRNVSLSYDNKFTRNFLAKVNFDFIGVRKITYIASGIVIAIGLISLVVRGLNYGVDFAGGRTYVVRFDQDINTVKLGESLSKHFNSNPEVKTFGPHNQVKITTKYLIDIDSIWVDSVVESKLYDGVKNFYKSPISIDQFLSDADGKIIGKLSSQKVFPTIADDIKRDSSYALFFALIVIFLYIAARFRKWQFGIGGLIATLHDAFITVSIYSIFYGILPFNLEVDQVFIAAILTVIGYSVNDTVIVFDRIREFSFLHPKHTLKNNMNAALNSTLGRTLNTAGTTLVVLLTILLFGGEVIRGFAFALFMGVLIGTFSSLFVASPIAFDTINYFKRKKELKLALSKK